jgi:hypothetical protein
MIFIIRAFLWVKYPPCYAGFLNPATLKVKITQQVPPPPCHSEERRIFFTIKVCN